MASSTSLGWGIALQSGDRKDYLGQMADNITKMGVARAKAAEKAAKEERKIINDSLEKIEVPAGNQYVPMFLTRMQDISKEGVNEIVRMKQEGASASDIYIKASEYRNRLQTINNNNTVAWDISTTKDFVVPESFRTALMNPKGKPEDLEPFVNSFFGIKIDPETYAISFAKIPKEIKVPQLKYDLIDEPTGTTKKAGSTTKELLKSSVSDKSIQDAAAGMFADRNTAEQLVFEAIYENPIDVIKKLKVNEGETMTQYLQRNEQESAADPSIPNVKERALAIAAEKVRAKADSPTLIWKNRPQPRVGKGGSKSIKETPFVRDLFEEVGQRKNQSDWKEVSSMQITIDASNLGAIIATNPELKDLITEGDIITFTPNTAEGEYDSGSINVLGEWNISDNETKLKGRGRQQVAVPDMNGVIPYVYAESAFINSLGANKDAEIKANKWFAKMLNKSLDIKDYSPKEQEAVKAWMKKNGVNDTEAGVAFLVRELAKKK